MKMKDMITHDLPDFTVKWPDLCNETMSAVTDYIKSGKPLSISDSSGVVGELENKLSEYFERKYTITYNSGTSAFLSAYLALDLSPGSEILVPDVGFHAFISPALHCGLTPVIVDVEQDTGNISVSSCTENLSEKTKVIVVHHHWGHPADMDEIVSFARKHNLYIIEDMSHAFGSEYKSRKIGTFGDISICSMQESKHISAGEGGFLMTDDTTLFERCCLHGHYRGRCHTKIHSPELKLYAETGFGLKFRIHPLAAVLALKQMEKIESQLHYRQLYAEQINSLFEKLLGLEGATRKPYVTRHSYFAHRPRYVQGQLSKLAPDTFDNFILKFSEQGLRLKKPSVRTRLSAEPLFTRDDVPVKHAQATWKPRFSKNLEHAERYHDNMLSSPIYFKEEHKDMVMAYADKIEKICNSLR